MSSLSQTSSKQYYARVDRRGRILIPETWRQDMKLKEGSWVELEFHSIDNMPAIIATQAKTRNGH